MIQKEQVSLKIIKSKTQTFDLLVDDYAFAQMQSHGISIPTFPA
jgi:Na+-translocating ferredoxin:NAD+ oxidoreductase RnfE subunit